MRPPTPSISPLPPPDPLPFWYEPPPPPPPVAPRRPVVDRTAPPEELEPITEPEQLRIEPVEGQYTLPSVGRSEEHTSELQSRQYLVCRLLLEKKKKSYEHNIN